MSTICAQNEVPVHDTVCLSLTDIEGRWIEKNEDQPDVIYLFRSDSTFFKALDNSEVLIFNVAGKFKIYNDTIRIVYQDMSRMLSTPAKIRTMYLKIISLSEDELNIQKTENLRTAFIRLRRQNKQ